jgi:spore maturation protein CgeB
MKFLKITTVYDAYWRGFYKSSPALLKGSYAEQKLALDYDAFGWADFWFHALAPLGYEVMEVTANIYPLQKAWALENGFSLNSNWLLEIPFQQTRKFQPTVLFIDDFSTFPNSWLMELKQTCPSICLIVGWCGAPYRDASIFNAYDLVLSCIPELVEEFRSMGHHSEHLNHAFEPRILERINIINQPEIDFSFIGQIVRDNQYHLRRQQILEHLASRIPIEIYSRNDMISWKSQLKVWLKISMYNIMRSLKQIGIPQNWLNSTPKLRNFASLPEPPLYPVISQLRLFMKPAVFGLKMFQTLHNSKLTFNNHIDISPRSASNMRMFEATGCGTCLVTDWKENIHTLFEPDKEVVTYKSAEECVEKVEWLLQHPKTFQEIALAGQKRTLKYHTFAQRAIQLDDLIIRELQK